MKLKIRESDNKRFMKEGSGVCATVRIRYPHITQVNNIKITSVKYDEKHDCLDFVVEGNMKADGYMTVRWCDITAKLYDADIDVTNMTICDLDRDLVNYDEHTNTISIDNKLIDTLKGDICYEISYMIDGGNRPAVVDDSLIENPYMKEPHCVDSISFALSNKEQIDDLNYQYEYYSREVSDSFADFYADEDNNE